MAKKPATEGVPVAEGISRKLFNDFVKTEADMREWKALKRKESHMWELFWIRQMHKHGHSNVAIAKRLGLAESTIRYHLKKES